MVLETIDEVGGLDGATVGAIILPEGLEVESPHPLIRVKDTRFALAQLTELFRPPEPDRGVSPHAHIHPNARLGRNVSIAAGVVLEADVVVGDGCSLGPGCVVGRETVLGEGCILHAHVTLYERVRLGARVRLHSGVVIGADGFGYAQGPQGAVKIHHLGTVELEDDVEVGANTCIDRSTLSETRIGARTKIDNLCQIAHNVFIGRDCLIAGLVGVSGSTTLGDGVVVGGGAAFADHLKVGDGARIAGRAGVTKNVPAGETWAGFPAEPYRKWVRGLYLKGRLETVWQRVKGLG